MTLSESKCETNVMKTPISTPDSLQESRLRRLLEEILALKRSRLNTTSSKPETKTSSTSQEFCAICRDRSVEVELKSNSSFPSQSTLLRTLKSGIAELTEVTLELQTNIECLNRNVKMLQSKYAVERRALKKASQELLDLVGNYARQGNSIAIRYYTPSDRHADSSNHEEVQVEDYDFDENNELP